MGAGNTSSLLRSSGDESQRGIPQPTPARSTDPRFKLLEINPAGIHALSLNLQHLKCFDELTLIHSSSTSRLEFFISFKKEMGTTEVVSFIFFFFSRIHEVSK